MHDDTFREQGFATQCSNTGTYSKAAQELPRAGEGTENTQGASYTLSPTFRRAASQNVKHCKISCPAAHPLSSRMA